MAYDRVCGVERYSQDNLAEAFAEHRQRLLVIAERRLNPILLKRLSAEDVVSETYVNAAKRLDYFASHDDVPVYYKLRTILLQTITDVERRHLKAQGRDACREIRIDDTGLGSSGSGSGSGGDVRVGEIAADITSPVSRVDRDERHALLRRALATMAENDRAILVVRHFDGMGNAECAAALGIEPKAASIRYVRALERLQQKLVEVSCFRKS